MSHARVFGLGLTAILLAACGGSAPKASEPSGARSESAPAGYAGPTSPAYAGPMDAPASAGVPATPGAMGAAAPAASGPPPAAPSPVAASAEKAAAAPSTATAVAKDAPVARPEPALPQSGQLTAGVWDDNRNFDFWKPYAARFQERGRDFSFFSADEMAQARSAANGRQEAKTELDIQLVLDTTGSMGDELRYLQSELDSIAGELRHKFPNVTPRWSLVVYRDRGDEYLTRKFDFTTDTTRFRSDLRAQSAGGGGDTPEAVVEGLSVGLGLGWRQDKNVAKVAFWVADAPSHPGEGQAFAHVVRKAAQKGVHIYPIASSDTDEVAEYEMRSAAQLTGGRYVFLTDDSGIGNAHAEPHIPCYNVTRLDQAIVRMIQIELTGRHAEPEARQVVRQVGKPKDGKCALASGMVVASY
ncbi:MAG: VWA domain-containing protein [Myxococcales bacterium]|nr:VWA domain-containing protein [Myxococcales bacterium]